MPATDSAGDGLDVLDARRAQRRRPLPPRNPRQLASTVTPAAESAQRVPEEASVAPQPLASVSPAHQQVPVAPLVTPSNTSTVPDTAHIASASEQAVEPEEEQPEPLRLAQFYVTPAIDTYLRQVRAEAIVSNLDVTASAVAREALVRLMEQATPSELVRLLAEPKMQSRRGRPRR